jgi:glycogen operon protein
VPQPDRGTCAGLASKPVIEYLKRLGVTAVELMPLHSFVNDRHLVENGLSNYWGYNTIGFFAPDAPYSATGDINEFKTMVKRLHSNGIDVILDVVYNHTAESNHMGPTLCFRATDNAAYYRLVGGNRRYYMDYTGCGNSLNADHKTVAFRMPAQVGIARRGVRIDTSSAVGKRADRRTFDTRESYPLQGRSTALLHLMRSPVR